MAEGHLAGALAAAAECPTRRSARPCCGGGVVGDGPARRRGGEIMKIAALEIDGYGVWSGLKVERLSDGMNVLYGPNEAGKTTLLQFVRSVLYGFSPERRRYFPPVHGGRPGGWIEVVGANGRFQIDRHDDADGAARPRANRF